MYANRDIGKDEIIFEIPYGLALETGDTLKDGEFGTFLIGGDLEDVDIGKLLVVVSELMILMILILLEMREV